MALEDTLAIVVVFEDENGVGGDIGNMALV